MFYLYKKGQRFPCILPSLSTWFSTQLVRINVNLRWYTKWSVNVALSDNIWWPQPPPRPHPYPLLPLLTWIKELIIFKSNGSWTSSVYFIFTHRGRCDPESHDNLQRFLSPCIDVQSIPSYTNIDRQRMIVRRNKRRRTLWVQSFSLEGLTYDTCTMLTAITMKDILELYTPNINSDFLLNVN